MSIVERVWAYVGAVARGAGDETYGVVRDALGALAPVDERASDALKNDARGDAARALLAKALTEATADLQTACDMAGQVPDHAHCAAVDLRPEGAVLRWDAAAADWLVRREHLGEAAGPSARGLLKKAADRAAVARGDLDVLWAGWLRPADAAGAGFSPILVTLASLLWKGQVKDELERLRVASRRHPGVVLGVADRLQPALVSGARLGAGDGETRALVGGTGEPAGTIVLCSMGTTPAVDAQALEVLTRSVQSLGRLITHRAVRWLVTTAHERADRGDHEPRIITARGWSDLAERVGGTSKKDAGNLRDALLLLDRLRFDLPDGSNGRLLSLRYWRPLGGRGVRHRVDVTVEPPLMPHYVRDLPRGQKRIVPLTDLPPFVGRAQEHGNQAALQLAVLGEMSRRSEEIPRTGGICLSAATWGRLATRTRVPASTLDRVVDRWLHDGDDGAAFLRATGRDRYALAPAHHSAWEFLMDSGARRTGGEEAGKKSAEAKRKGRRGGSRSRGRGSK